MIRWFSIFFYYWLCKSISFCLSPAIMLYLDMKVLTALATKEFITVLIRTDKLFFDFMWSASIMLLSLAFAAKQLILNEVRIIVLHANIGRTLNIIFFGLRWNTNIRNLFASDLQVSLLVHYNWLLKLLLVVLLFQSVQELMRLSQNLRH